MSLDNKSEAGQPIWDDIQISLEGREIFQQFLKDKNPPPPV